MFMNFEDLAQLSWHLSDLILDREHHIHLVKVSLFQNYKVFMEYHVITMVI